jgi:alanine-glyoxylate transaminase/serine-glyoxylate transaminase/serine-pyruvate transaminase
MMGIDVQLVDYGNRSDIDMDQVTQVLAADTEHRIKAVLCVQVDTATSVRNDIPALRETMDASDHPALLMVDCIACLGCDRFEMDAWGVDLMVACSQKGLMTPPGMSFVFFNDKADRARDTADCVGGYWDWRPRMDPQIFSNYFCGTAPTHHLYGLRVALDMIVHEEGVEAVWARHAKLASAVHAALDTWAQDGPLALNITDPAKRSHAVTSVRIGAPQGTMLRNWLTEKAGVTLGIGLGMSDPKDPNADGFFRIGHMGHVNAHMVLGTLGAIEAGLSALNIPHAQGGLSAAAKVVSEA